MHCFARYFCDDSAVRLSESSAFGEENGDFKFQVKETESGEAANAFFASFLGTKKEVGNGGKAPNTPTQKAKKESKKQPSAKLFRQAKAAKSPMLFSLPFWAPKRKWGTGAKPRIHQRRNQKKKAKSGKLLTFSTYLRCSL